MSDTSMSDTAETEQRVSNAGNSMLPSRTNYRGKLSRLAHAPEVGADLWQPRDGSDRVVQRVPHNLLVLSKRGLEGGEACPAHIA